MTASKPDIATVMPTGVDALIVFDGVCVLCNAFARFVARFDQQMQFRLTTAQGPLGQTLYRTLDLPTDRFETNLVIINGEVYQKMASFGVVMRALGLPWSLLAVVDLLPLRMADWIYDRIAGNRYRMFGRHKECPLPPPEIRNLLI